MPPDPTHVWNPVTECCTGCGCLAYVAVALKPCLAPAVPDAPVAVDWFALNRSVG